MLLLINQTDTTALSHPSANETLIQNFDIALTGCTVTLSVLDNELQSILKKQEVDGGLSSWEKVKFARNEDALKKVMDELRGQREALTLLISVVQSQSLVEILSILKAKDDVFKGVKRRTDTLCNLQKGRDLSEDGQLNLSDNYSIFSEATGRNFFDFDDEILQSPAYRKVYSSVRDVKHLKRTSHRPSAMAANLLDDDDLIQLDNHPPLAATYSKELEKEMLVDQTGENLPEISVTGESNQSTCTDSENAVFEVSDVRTTRTSQSSHEFLSEDLRTETGNHLLALSLADVHNRSTEHLNSDRTEEVSLQSSVIKSTQLESGRVPQLVQERRKDANTSEISSQLDEATALPEDVALESNNFSPACQMLNPIHPEFKATNLSDNPLVTASALGSGDAVRSILLLVEVIDMSAINMAFFYAACNGHTTVIEMLLLRSADVNCRLSGTVQFCGGLHVSLSSLHFAAANNQSSMIEFLLDNGADINIKDGSSWTPLHVAAARGCSSAVELLLQRGAVLEACIYPTGVEMTSTKSQSGKRNIDKDGPQSTDSHLQKSTLGLEQAEGYDGYNLPNCTALYLAVFFSFPDTVRVLLANGANKDAKAGHGMTVLHAAASGKFGSYTRMFKNGALSSQGTRYYLLDDKLSFPPAPNPCESGTSSPALLASDRVQILELLVQNGCGAQQSDDFGFTPLHLACLQDSLEVLESLLKITRNVSAVSSTGWTPLHLAALFGRENQAKAILDAGGNLEASYVVKTPLFGLPPKETTPLMIGVQFRHHTLTRFLLQRGASKELPGSRINILHHAAVCSSKSLLVMLAKQGIGWQRKLTKLDVHIPLGMSDENWLPLSLRIDINAPYTTGLTPLLEYSTSKRPVLTVVQVMLDLKADVKARDESGQSVLHFNLNPEVASVLIEAGADLEARDSLGYTPLLGAIHHHHFGHFDHLRKLIFLGADIYAKDDLGRSAWKILSDKYTPTWFDRATLGFTSFSAKEIKELLKHAKKTRRPPRGWKE